jgi:ankyrin repeat protein
VSARSEFGHSPLHVAALHDNAEAVDLLLDKVGRPGLKTSHAEVAAGFDARGRGGSAGRPGRVGAAVGREAR